METLITQREAAERITEVWGIPMHETKLSVLISAGVGPSPHSRRGASTMYWVVEVDQWAAEQTLKTRGELVAQIASIDAVLKQMGY